MMNICSANKLDVLNITHTQNSGYGAVDLVLGLHSTPPAGGPHDLLRNSFVEPQTPMLCEEGADRAPALFQVRPLGCQRGKHRPQTYDGVDHALYTSHLVRAGRTTEVPPTGQDRSEPARITHFRFAPDCRATVAGSTASLGVEDEQTSEGSRRAVLPQHPGAHA